MRSQILYRFVVPVLRGGSFTGSSASLELETATYGDIITVACDNMAELPFQWLQLAVQQLPAFFHAAISVNSYVSIDKMLARLVALPRETVLLARLQHTTVCYFSTCNTSQALRASDSSKPCSCMRIYKGWDTEAPSGTAPSIDYQPDTLLPVEIEGDAKQGNTFTGVRKHEQVCQHHQGEFHRPFWAPLSPAIVVSTDMITSFLLSPAQSQLCQFIRYGPGPMSSLKVPGRPEDAAAIWEPLTLGTGTGTNSAAHTGTGTRTGVGTGTGTASHQGAQMLSQLPLLAGMADVTYMLGSLSERVSMVSDKEFMTLGRDMELIEDVYRLEDALLVQRLNNSTTMRLLHKLLGSSREGGLAAGGLVGADTAWAQQSGERDPGHEAQRRDRDWQDGAEANGTVAEGMVAHAMVTNAPMTHGAVTNGVLANGVVTREEGAGGAATDLVQTDGMRKGSLRAQAIRQAAGAALEGQQAAAVDLHGTAGLSDRRQGTGQEWPGDSTYDMLHDSAFERHDPRHIGETHQDGREKQVDVVQASQVGSNTVAQNQGGQTQNGPSKGSISITLQLQTAVGSRDGHVHEADQLAATVQQEGEWVGVGLGTRPGVKPRRKVRLGLTILVGLAVFHVLVVVGLWVYVHRTMRTAAKKYDPRHVNMMYTAMWGGSTSVHPGSAPRKGLLGRY